MPGSRCWRVASYRLAALQMANGEREAAVASYTEAFTCAGEPGDPLHQQVIAADLGLHLLDSLARQVLRLRHLQAGQHSQHPFERVHE
jgi:hypothetical protein